ncbi:hypothetical protein [Promicromonospora soli]
MTNQPESNVRQNRNPLTGRRYVRRRPTTAQPPSPTGLPDVPTAAIATSAEIGPALLAVELALTGDGPWDVAERAINELTEDPDVSGAASLFHGVPAAALVMDAAAVDGYFDLRDPQLVREALEKRVPEPRLFRETQLDLDEYLRKIVGQRLAVARARREANHPLTSAEFGLVEGILGLGVILLRRAPGGAVMQQVIDYVVGLTRPVLVDGLELPGWYVPHDRAPGSATRGGHVSMTMADGAAGLLAFLATCVNAGYSLNSLRRPITDLVDWFVAWQQPASAEVWPDSVWWPRWVTPDEIRAGPGAGIDRVDGEALPSWSGMAGMARALQMGAGVLDDRRNPRAQEAREIRSLAEKAMLACLTDKQLRRLPGPGLWDGLAGAYQTGYRAAADASGPMEIRLKHRMSAVGDALRAHARAPAAEDPVDFWTGRSGLLLAAQSLWHLFPSASRWDACMAITGNPRPTAPRSTPWS